MGDWADSAAGKVLDTESDPQSSNKKVWPGFVIPVLRRQTQVDPRSLLAR